MKEDEASFLEIFQDPLLTIVALILLNTTWVVIPERMEVEEHKPSVSVRSEIISIEDTINKLKIEIKRKQEELGWLKKKIGELNAMLQGGGEDINQINQKIQELQTEIENKKEELKQLEDVLKKAKEELTHLPGIENIEGLYARISELEREIQVRRSELNQLEEQIKIAKKHRADTETRADEQKKLIAQFQIKLKALLEEIENLKSKLQGKEFEGGFQAVFESDKEDCGIELVKNRAFPVDEKYYDAYVVIDNGGRIITKMTRKASFGGEDSTSIKNSESEFQKTLKKINPKTHRIVFILHNDSFEIYRKAKKLVLEKNLEIGLITHNEDFIYFGPSDGKKKESITR